MDFDSRTARRDARRQYRNAWRAANPRHELAHRIAWGGGLIAVGVLWLLHEGEPGILGSAMDVFLIGPLLMAWSGLVTIVVERSPRAVVSGLTRLAIAAWLYVVFHQIGGWTFQNTWPVMLIVVGACTLAKALFDRHPTSLETTEERAQ